MERDGGTRRQVQYKGRSQSVAARRPDAHCRNPRAGHRRRPIRPGRLVSLHPEDPRGASFPRGGANLRGARRLGQRNRTRRDRHTRRCDQADRASREAVEWRLRCLSDGSP